MPEKLKKILLHSEAFFLGFLMAFDFSGLIGLRMLHSSAAKNSERKSDRENLASDWNKIGQDFYSVLESVNEK
nr:MAG TPA: hypothetical protein [Caudoviricetes sp.]